MSDQIKRLKEMTTGDRWLLGLFIPPISCVLGYMLFVLYTQHPRTLMGKLLVWGFLEFFATCFLFSVLLFLWVTFQSGWIEHILLSTVKNVVIWVAIFIVIGLVGGAIAKLML